jgi:uncharacterized protein
MSEDLLDVFTRQYIEGQAVPLVTFAWQGGEPLLMGPDFFWRAVELQEQYRRPGMRIVNALQTNGTLLDDTWCHFFREHNFLVGLSLDGPRDLHDAYRVDKRGRTTFNMVMEGLQLLKKHEVEFNILTCVHAANGDHPLKVYRFLRDEVGASFIQFIPIVQRDDETGFQEHKGTSARSVAPQQYGDFLVKVFDEWVTHDVGQVFVQIFDVALAGFLGQSGGLCVFQQTCGRALVLEHNGDLYSCDHFVEPRYMLGNIRARHLFELVNSRQQSRFGRAKWDKLPNRCRRCDVRFLCNGGCPKNRIFPTKDGRPVNYLCDGYRAFFTHIEGPMRIMAAALRMHKPASVVMDILAEESSRV